MYCPQCGTLIQEDAVACQNCGALPNDEHDPDDKVRKASGKAQVTALVMVTASLGIGMLSFWPYLYLASRYYYPILRQKLSLPGAFDLACLGGFPLGIIGIVLSALALRKMPNNLFVVIMAVLGILLSLGGIAGHVWFIATCQFCQ
jgi:hypothetical protein